ncbi:MAG: inorganic diphosphatase [Saprospiraceae bacterium]|nr:inorganic diphosphatase [Saprospiraceae bacterium]
MNHILKFLVLLLFFFNLHCKQNMATKQSTDASDFYNLPTFSEDKFIQAVIEIPAGTNHKFEFNKNTKQFINDKNKDGSVRVINFLGYPGNYGFIPSTLMDEERGGDGDPLDVVVLSESVPTGTVLEVVPIATLLLRDEGETDTKIIAIPADKSKRTIQATNLHDFLIQYNSAMRIVQDWFVNYEAHGIVQFLGWEDEKYALQEIEKWKIH